MVTLSSSAATWTDSFEDGQKLALATNRFMLVDFWATWCGPCKKMDIESWSNKEVQALLENFVPVRVDIDLNRPLAEKYGINSIPNMYILDANGQIVYSFVGYHDPMQLKLELEKFALSTEFLSMELINAFKTKSFTTTTRLVQKYFDYSMYVPSKVRVKFVTVGLAYLKDAKRQLEKKSEDYSEKLQKAELLELSEYAFEGKYSKLDKKLADQFPENKILEDNLPYFYFLKLVAAKGNNSANLAAVEERAASIEGFDYFAKKAETLLAVKDQ